MRKEKAPPLDRAISAVRGVSAEASELPEHSVVGKQRASQGRSQALHGDSTPQKLGLGRGGSGSLGWTEARKYRHASERPVIGIHDVRVSSGAQCTLPPISFSVLGAQYGTHGSLCTAGAPYIFSGGLNLVDAWHTLLSLRDHMVSGIWLPHTGLGVPLGSTCLSPSPFPWEQDLCLFKASGS